MASFVNSIYVLVMLCTFSLLTYSSNVPLLGSIPSVYNNLVAVAGNATEGVIEIPSIAGNK